MHNSKTTFVLVHGAWAECAIGLKSLFRCKNKASTLFVRQYR